jgi:hypothetical protein
MRLTPGRGASTIKCVYLERRRCVTGEDEILKREYCNTKKKCGKLSLIWAQRGLRSVAAACAHRPPETCNLGPKILI